MTTYQDQKKTVAKACRAAGYATDLAGLGRAGRDAFVSATVYGTEGAIVVCVGVDPALPQDERAALWMTHGRDLAAKLEAAGLKVDYETYGTRRDYRAFVVRF